MPSSASRGHGPWNPARTGTPDRTDTPDHTDDSDRRGPRRLLDVLVCPVCTDRLHPHHGSLRCAGRHTFDIARQGYVALLTGRPGTGTADTAEMTQARAAFLAAGHYAPLSSALADVCSRLCPPDGVVLDAGTGTGHHLAHVLDALPSAVGLGLDPSVPALRRAARAHPRAGAASWDVWRPLPVRSGSVDVVLDVLAPRNVPEFHRVLRPGGALVVVVPSPRHLDGLKQPLGLLSVDPDKEHRLDGALAGFFRTCRTEPLEFSLELSADGAENAVAMGPSARHLSPGALHRRIAGLRWPRRVTASFLVTVHRPLP